MKLLLATVLGAVAIFVWGFIAWMALPFHQVSTKTLKNEAAVAQLLAQETERGVFMIPNHSTPDGAHRSQDEWMTAQKAGPFLLGSMRPGKINRPMASYMAAGFVVALLQSGILVLILNKVKLGYRCSIILSGFIGLFTAVAAWLPAWNWFGYPLDYIWPYALDYVAQGILAGAVIGRFTCNPNAKC